MTAKHSPLPWKLNQTGGQKNMVSDGCFYIGNLHEFNEANAALIVEAVNNYATLREQRDELASALEIATCYYPRKGEGVPDAHDRINALFLSETGEISPMADHDDNQGDSVGNASQDWHRRKVIWDKWHADRKARVIAALAKAGA